MQKINIEKALEQDAIFIDTRSPAEYNLDHIPNAINPYTWYLSKVDISCERNV